MSTQIAVRLPDHLMEFIDRQVREGSAASRAAVVTTAIEHERQKKISESDAEILARTLGVRDDLDDLAEYATRLPMDID